MNAIEFVKKEGLWVFKYALAQLSFNKDMFLVVYHYECEFVSEVKDNHGDCVFSYRDVKQIVDAFELVDKVGGVEESKLILAGIKPWHTGYNIVSKTYFGGDIFSQDQEFYIKDLLEAINLVEQCQ